ncbi:hypothetical protein MHBO_002912 [Bonamia ostreae]|uniref:Uncharacterized protein n=1 Tax=Bonamia ostreae TaxID=126728 RepID=A0ABV2ANY8_9EUKA
MSLNFEFNLPSTLINLKEDIIAMKERMDTLAEEIDEDTAAEFPCEESPSKVLDKLAQIEVSIPQFFEQIRNLEEDKKKLLETFFETVNENKVLIQELLSVCNLPSKSENSELVEDVIKSCQFLFSKNLSLF